MNLWTDIVEFFFPRLCLSCGRKLLLAEEGLCISCLAGLPYVALILYAMKYHGRKKLCRNMGRLMAGELLVSGFFEGIDYLLPVPLYRSRLCQRGYNQSELLARGVSEVTGISLCTDAIVRSRNNATQTHKSGYARWKNVEGLFQPTVNAPKLEGKHILLVDDVLTTGATLIACADALSELKSIRISVLTLAWAR